MKCLKICTFFLELTMSDFYKIKRKKHLLWDLNLFNEMNRIDEVRVCDCSFETTLVFMRECKRVDDLNELKEKFDDVILAVHVEDVFSIFGKVCILCCKTALYNLITSNLFQVKNYFAIVFPLGLNVIACIIWKKTFLF